ncbi:MAG: hypothetical protein Q4G70_04465 [Pseudomonadota bacterium]|nr:hypothetical protein [Pseudomonadota bacterium]
MNFQPVLVAAALLLSSTAYAATSAHNTDDVLPNSPWKEQGQPDAGRFNPTGGDDDAQGVVAAPVAPAAVTYPPAIVISERARKPYALVAAPTLPCAPGYCATRRARADRN